MGNRRSGELFGHLETLFRDGAIGGLSDAQLLERFVAGRDEAGEAAFRALVARHGPMVLRVCRSVLGDAHEAEDAFQVTFLALARKAGSIRKQGSIGSWLHGTAHRVALKARSAARRRLARESRMAEVDVSSQSPPPIPDGELSPILHEEIERLPAKYRAPIVLCYLEGMTQEQAAVELGWPAGTVRGRLARARDLLRSRLTRRGLALSAGLAASTSEASAAGLSAALIEATVRAALGRSTAAKLSRAAALLLKTVLRDMALARLVQLAVPLLLIALVVGGAALLAYSGGPKLPGEWTSLAKIESVRPPTSTDPFDDPLPEGALARLGTTLFLHGSHVKHVTYSPDGATLAALDGNGALYLWDPSTGRERRRFETGSGHVTDQVQFAYAPDGRSLAVQAEDVGDEIIKGRGREHFRWTKLFDPITGHELRRFDGQGTATCLAFSPDGKLLAGSVRNGRTVVITLWEVASGRVLRTIGGPFAVTLALTFSPDGNVLISCGSRTRENMPRPNAQRAGARPTSPSEETSIQCWDVATGNEVRRIGLGKARINAAVLAADGKSLATAATDTAVRLWDLTTGRELRQFGGSDVYTSHLAFSPDGTKLASTEWVGPALPSPTAKMPLTGPIHVWDTASGRELRNWEADNGSLAGFSRDGTTLVTAGEQVIRLWDVASGREIRPHAGHHSAIEDAAYSPDGRSIVTLGHDRTVRFWDPVTGREVRRFEAGEFGIRFAALSGDGKTLATGGGFQPTRLWDAASGRELRRSQTLGQVRDAIVECADLSPDGKTLATSVSRGVDFWDTVTGDRRPGAAMSPIGTGFIKALRFAPDGRTVATVYGDWVRFWDAASSRETRRIALPAKGRPNNGFSRTAARLAFSPDGTTLAATNERDGLIFLLDIASGRELGRVDGPDDYKALAFSPDGKFLASGVDISKGLPDHELSVRLWDVAARKEIGRVSAHRNSIRALAFSPDGKRLLTASEDATALVWDVAALTGRGIVGPPPTALSNAGTPPVSR